MTTTARARGCLLGQLTGDALGSLVEFQSPEEIRHSYPEGVRDLADGGTWDTLAGQPTDDSEMALLLARMLVKQGTYNATAAQEAYIYWLNSGPFDCGMTVATGLRGDPNPESQANGAMMRASPLGIFGAHHPLSQTADWAQQDAALTHPNPLCLQANALYTMAIAHAIHTGADPQTLYRAILDWATEMPAEPKLLTTIQTAPQAPPPNYTHQQGWVLIAFGNALWQLLHTPTLEEAIVDTIMHGGDTDTNAAICGALLGAVHGLQAIPTRWVEAVLHCRPEAGQPGVHQPRPQSCWPVDALDLADQLLTGAENTQGHPTAACGKQE